MTKLRAWWHRFAHEPQGAKLHNPNASSLDDACIGIAIAIGFVWLLFSLI